jgi:hypothetical protein
MTHALWDSNDDQPCDVVGVLRVNRIEKEMDVFVEPVEFDSGWLEPAMSVSSGDIGMISAKTNGYGYINQTIQRSSMLNPDNPPKPELELERYEWLKVGKLQPSLNHYKLRLITFVNGQPTEGSKRVPIPPSLIVHDISV